MTRLVLLMLGLFIMPSFMSPAVAFDPSQPVGSATDEQAQHNAIFEKIKAAVAANDFASLSAMEDDFRSSRARTPSGIWKLQVLHTGLQFYLADGLDQENGCQYRDEQFVRQWAAATPRNPAPEITDAALLLKQAWCIRGNGYADSVAVDAWPKFREGLAAASEVLEKHKEAASVDPEYYAVKLDLSRAQGLDKTAFHALLQEATAREPAYYNTYFTAAWYYLPQWGGSYPELEEFARYAVERSRTTEGNGVYARIFWYLGDCGCQIIEKAANWTMMKQSMRDIYTRYPATWNGDYFVNLTCRMKDEDEGHQYIRAMHPEAVNEISFVALFASCDNHAKTGK